MGGLSRSLLASAIILSILFHTEGGFTYGQQNPTDNEIYEVNMDTLAIKGRCILEIKIKGKGVEDVFRRPCVDNLEVVNTKDVLVIGDPEKNPYCFFSDSPATLFVLKDGDCTQKSYFTLNGKTSSTSSELDECDEIEAKIKKELEKKRQSDEDDNMDETYDISMDSYERRGRCIQEIKIKGKGVEDTFRGTCVENLEVVNTKDVLVIGEPEKTPYCYFSDSPATLVVLKNGQCTKKSYFTDNGKTRSTSSELDIDECDRLEEKIIKELEKKRNVDKVDKKGGSQFLIKTETLDRKGKCFKKLTIEGNGVKDSFTVACEEEMEVIRNTNDELIVGNPEKSPFSLFSNTSSTLVVVKDGLCRQRSYTTVNGMATIASSPLDDNECDEIEEIIQSELKEKRKTEKGTKLYDVAINENTVKGRCAKEIKIKGNGVEDFFTTDCEDLDVSDSNNILRIGDPLALPFFCLYSDETSSLVVIENGQCRKKQYKTVNGRTTTKSSLVLVENVCKELMGRIGEMIKKSKGGREGEERS